MVETKKLKNAIGDLIAIGIIGIFFMSVPLIVLELAKENGIRWWSVRDWR